VIDLRAMKKNYEDLRSIELSDRHLDKLLIETTKNKKGNQYGKKMAMIEIKALM
jgi:hypothetical protein